MRYDYLIQELKPRNYGSFEVEGFESYRQNANVLLPNWPNCALESWLHRHYAYAVDNYGWLRFDKFSFRKESWDSETIYNEINSHKMDYAIDSLGNRIYSTHDCMKSWLQNYMLKHRTWPVPIIILNNEQNYISPSGEIYGQPFHLLEGHLRLAYLRRMYLKERDSLNKEHDVWIVDILECD